MIRRLRSGRERRRLLAWRRYAARNDRLVAGQAMTSRIQHPMRTNPGLFRAEGWPTRHPWCRALRHGS